MRNHASSSTSWACGERSLPRRYIAVQAPLLQKTARALVGKIMQMPNVQVRHTSQGDSEARQIKKTELPFPRTSASRPVFFRRFPAGTIFSFALAVLRAQPPAGTIFSFALAILRPQFRS